MLMHIVQHLLLYVATVESSRSASSGPSPWKAARWLTLQWLGSVHMTPHHMISHMDGLCRDPLYIGPLGPIHELQVFLHFSTILWAYDCMFTIPVLPGRVSHSSISGPLQGPLLSTPFRLTLPHQCEAPSPPPPCAAEEEPSEIWTITCPYSIWNYYQP
jgi:hypothetical protein